MDDCELERTQGSNHRSTNRPDVQVISSQTRRLFSVEAPHFVGSIVACDEHAVKLDYHRY